MSETPEESSRLGAPTYACDACGKVFLTSRARDGHQNIHTGPQAQRARIAPARLDDSVEDDS